MVLAMYSLVAPHLDPQARAGARPARTGVINHAPTAAGLTRVYFSMFDYGLFRSTAKGTYEQVFASAGGGDIANSAGSRTEFALAPNGGKLRIYLGDTDGKAGAGHGVRWPCRVARRGSAG